MYFKFVYTLTTIILLLNVAQVYSKNKAQGLEKYSENNP